MKKNEKGITLIVLVITIVVLLIIAGISIGAISDETGIIKNTEETTKNAQRESIIQKIESDLYTEKVKTGEKITKEKLKKIILEKGYYSNMSEDEFVTKDGNYTIKYEEIIGWGN